MPGTSARIGMTLCLGKTSPWGRHGAWHRGMVTDLAVIEGWSAHTLISLMEDHEFEVLGVTGLREAARARGMEWRHWPIRERDIPDERFEAGWAADIDTIASDLQAGQSISAPLYGLAGRTSMVAARLLMYFGLPASETVQSVRAARPGAIETGAKLDYVCGLGHRISSGRVTQVPDDS